MRIRAEDLPTSASASTAEQTSFPCISLATNVLPHIQGFGQNGTHRAPIATKGNLGSRPNPSSAKDMVYAGSNNHCCPVQSDSETSGSRPSHVQRRRRTQAGHRPVVSCKGRNAEVPGQPRPICREDPSQPNAPGERELSTGRDHLPRVILSTNFAPARPVGIVYSSPLSRDCRLVI